MRADANSRSARRAGGFSLIEIVVALTLMSLAAGAVAPIALRQIAGNRQQATLERMKRIVVGIAGDRSIRDYGYVGDMGQLPDTLDDLNTRGIQTPYAIDATYAIGAGYNGPYVPFAGPAGALFVDSWNSPFEYTNTSAQITSRGPDRTLGSADDIIYPDADPVLFGDLVIRVVGIPLGGGSEQILDSSEANVFIASSVVGSRVESPVVYAGSFGVTNLRQGLHGIRVDGIGAYLGASARDVIEIRQGSRVATLVIEEQP